MFLVERDRKKFKVCTRCDLSGDKRIKILLTGKEPAKDLIDFDPLGAFVLAMELGDAKKNKVKKAA